MSPDCATDGRLGMQGEAAAPVGRSTAVFPALEDRNRRNALLRLYTLQSMMSMRPPSASCSGSTWCQCMTLQSLCQAGHAPQGVCWDWLTLRTLLTSS